MTASFFALACLLSVDAARVESTTGSLFQPLPESSVYDGCGCTFRRAGDGSPSNAPTVFSSNYEGVARIATAEGVIELMATRADVTCSPSRVGGRCTLKYRNDELRIFIKARATWVCPEGDEFESCEVVQLRGQMAGQAIGVEEVVEVQGECGC